MSPFLPMLTAERIATQWFASYVKMGTYDWLSVNPCGNTGSRRRSKNNLRGITMGTGPIWGITSLTFILSCISNIYLLKTQELTCLKSSIFFFFLRFAQKLKRGLIISGGQESGSIHRYVKCSKITLKHRNDTKDQSRGTYLNSFIITFWQIAVNKSLLEWFFNIASEIE